MIDTATMEIRQIVGCPRENVVRYGLPQAYFADDPAAALDDLYRRSVHEGRS